MARAETIFFSIEVLEIEFEDNFLAIATFLKHVYLRSLATNLANKYQGMYLYGKINPIFRLESISKSWPPSSLFFTVSLLICGG